jgi:crotonobetainyl-CoA:carnitine CoA-transferase CaiB-like acyl-CoA transferase
MNATPLSANQALRRIWLDAQLPAPALDFARLSGSDPVLPSSFAVGTAVQASLAAAALAACEWRFQRGAGPRQAVSLDMLHAALECCGHFTLDGQAPRVWDKLSGLYRCGDGGHVRVHANFAHHRDGALALLGCPAGPDTERTAVAAALQRCSAIDFESAAAKAGLVVSAARDFATWDAHPQAQAMAGSPLVRIERIGDGAPMAPARCSTRDAPLNGLRVLDLTRILAGPVAGRTLAAYGADVMLVSSPHLPHIDAVAETSRGKRSAHVDLRTPSGRATLRHLLGSANVFLQGYRPGGLAALGFSPQDVAALRPGIACVSLSAYGPVGPWAARRGFDSLVQTATGFNIAEADAFGAAEPRALPMQVLDYGAGHLLAFGALAALLRQSQEGGSWHVQVSLAGVGAWLRALGRVPEGIGIHRPLYEPFLQAFDGGFGRVVAVRHAVQMADTPPAWTRPSVPPGTDAPSWE